MVYLHIFLTLALDGGEWLHVRLCSDSMVHGKLHQNGQCLECTETVCCNGNHCSNQIVYNLMWKYAVIKASFSKLS